MSLEQELEPKLTEIDLSARGQYDAVYLQHRGSPSYPPPVSYTP